MNSPDCFLTLIQSVSLVWGIPKCCSTYNYVTLNQICVTFSCCRYIGAICIGLDLFTIHRVVCLFVLKSTRSSQIIQNWNSPSLGLLIDALASSRFLWFLFAALESTSNWPQIGLKTCRRKLLLDLDSRKLCVLSLLQHRALIQKLSWWEGGFFWEGLRTRMNRVFRSLQQHKRVQ